MKYTLELLGRGRECYLHTVTDDEWNTLWALYKEHDGSFQEHDTTDILKYAGLSLENEYLIDKAFKSITGPFAEPSEFQLIVRNETGETIFDSTNLDAYAFQEVLNDEAYADEYPTGKWLGTGHEDELWICASEMIKGGFWTASIETEGEFDPAKLQLDIMTVVEDRILLVTGASYNGKKLQHEWLDDYTSRGLVIDINYPPSKWGQ